MPTQQEIDENDWSWLNPGAPGSRTAEINAGNPWGEADKPYVQAGDTGGYQEGVGITRKAGTSMTQAEYDQYLNDNAAWAGDDQDKRSYLERYYQSDPDDPHRAIAGYSNTPGGGAGQDAGSATSQYTSGAGGIGAQGESALAALLSMLQERQQQEQQERAGLREILMQQLAQMQQPVSVDSPGIREAVAANRIGLQRGTEQSRREIAERRAYDGSGGIGSKGYLTDVDRLQQQAGESGARFEGDIVFQQLTNQANRLQQLLTTALTLGDQESARTLAAQLQTIQQQLQQSNFYDDMGFRYSALQAQLNGQGASALLGGV